jgi:predicted MFS family arabinose efflux permease
MSHATQAASDKISPALPAPFKRLAWSNLAAQTAEQIGLAATPIVAVLALNADAGETGWLQTAQTLPFLLLAIPFGVLADRMSRRTLMAAAEAMRALSLIGILALIPLGWLSLPLLGALGFAGACGTVAYGIAAPALVPALVPEAALARANARIELARTLAFAGGPALAGALVGWAGAGPAFGFAAALSLGAVFLLAGIREPLVVAKNMHHDWRAELRDGARFVARHALLRPVFVTQFMFNSAFFMLQAVYVPYAVNHFGLAASGVGVTLAAYGVGMVAGALLAPQVMRALRFGTVIVIGPVAGFVAALTMAATIWLPWPALAALSFFLLGIGPILWVISTTTLRQTVTPRDLLGRVSAINGLAYGARPIGAAAGALVGGAWGAEACLIVCTAGFLLQMLMIFCSQVSGLKQQPAPAA